MLTIVVVGVGLCLLACLGGRGGSGDNSDDCTGHCERSPGWPGEPTIVVAPGGALIAAIETTPGESGSDSGAPITCGVVDSDGSPLPSEKVCPASSPDGGVVTNACATRYTCGACSQVWLDLGLGRCSFTLIATTGERRTVEVRRYVTGHLTCRAGCGGPWIDQTITVTDPSQIAVPFSPPDGGVSDSDGGARTGAGVFTQLSAGSGHTCGLRADRSVACWGASAYGSAAGGSFAQITAGDSHTCGLRDDGSATCWGDNSRRQSTSPLATFTQLSAGCQYTCGLRDDGSATCWGDNSYGQSTAPPGAFTQISTGWMHTCGLGVDGSATCWGGTSAGQAPAPAGTFTQISAGWRHTCGLRTDGSATCWGDNSFGQASPPAGI